MVRIARTLVVLATLVWTLQSAECMSAQPSAAAPATSPAKAPVAPAAKSGSTAPAAMAATMPTPPQTAPAAPAPTGATLVTNPDIAAETPVAEAPPAPTVTPATSASEENDLPDDEALPLDPKIKQDLEQRLKSLEAAGLSDDEKAKAVAFYQQAIESFDIAVQQMAAAQGFEKQLNALPAETADYSERLAKPLPPVADVSGEPLSAIEERAAKAEASLTHCRKEHASMIAEPKRRAQRLSEMPKLIADAQQRMKNATAELDSLGGDKASDVAAIARRAALTQTKVAVAATIQALQREQRLYAEGAQLIKIRRDYYARYVPHKEKRLELLNEEISSRRQNDAASQVAAAAKAVGDAQDRARPTIISQLATENKDFAEERIRSLPS